MIDNKLVILIKLIECKSYTKTALELNQTQPAISWSIKKLQEEYNINIFDKNKGLFKLTKQGKKLYEYAKLVINNENKLVESLQTKKKLKVGSTLSIADYYIPKNAINFNSIESFMVYNTETIINMIFDGEIDCAFIEGNFDHNELHSIKFTSANYICVSNNRTLNKVNNFDDLFRYTLLIREKGSGTRNILESYLELNNYNINSFKDLYSVNNFNLIKESLINSDSISFMYENVCHKEINENKLMKVDIEGFSLKHDLYFVYLENNILNIEIQNYYKDVLKML